MTSNMRSAHPRRRWLGVGLAAALACALVPPATAEPGEGPDLAEPQDVGDVVLEEDFEDIPDGELPEGWNAADGEWEVRGGELVGISTGQSQNSRITFGDSLENYRIEASVRFDAVDNDKRWAGVILDIDPDGSTPWSQAVMRSGSTASNGTEFAVRTTGDAWNVLTANPAPAEAGTGTTVHMAVEVQGGTARWFWEGEQLARTSAVPRSDGGVLGLVANGSQVAFDDLSVTEIEPASLLRDENEVAYGVAHRGYSTVAPENSRNAFAAAIGAGARGVELDVQQTSDGGLVLWHDDTIDGKSDGTGSISDHTLAELQQLDVGSWFSPAYEGLQITTWEEALDLIKGTGLLINLELKSGSVPDVLQPVLDRDMQEQVVFTNFSRDLIAQSREFAPEIRRGLIISTAEDDPMPSVEELDLSAYVAGADSVLDKPQIVPMLREAGVAVQAWTVNSATTWQQLIDLGIDGMLTDMAGEYEGYVAGISGGGGAPDPEPASVSILSPADGASLDRSQSLAVGVSAVNAASVSLTLDGEPIEVGEQVSLVRLAAGDHVVEASAEGAEPASHTFSLTASAAGLRALVDAAELSSVQASTLQGLISAGAWGVLAFTAETLARFGVSPDLMTLISADAQTL